MVLIASLLQILTVSAIYFIYHGFIIGTSKIGYKRLENQSFTNSEKEKLKN